MENPIKKILEGVKTKEELDVLKRGLPLLEQSQYKNKGGGVEEVLRSEFPRNIALALRDVLSDVLLGGSASKTADFLADLKKEISRIRILSIDLAFYPSEKAVDVLSGWVSRELGRDIVLDLSIDRGVIGGARFVFQGRYADFSLNRMIDDAMFEERERILGMIKPKPTEGTIKI